MKIVTKKLADGSFNAHAYAYVKGPKVASAKGRTRETAIQALQVILGRPDALAKLSAALDAKGQKARPTVAYIGGLILAYLESPEYAKLAPRTRDDYSKHLQGFDAEFGDWRTALFEDPRTTQDLAEWRDEHPSPRQGHMRLQVVSVLFTWARSRGITRANPTEPIVRIYNADRSDNIWSDEDLARVLAKSNPAIARAIRFASETGLRQGDLIRLPWSAISDVAIQVQTAKRKKRVIIPITPTLRETIEQTPRTSPVVLSNMHAKPWTSDGLRSTFDKTKKRAGITGLTWHDFRGTAVTRLYKNAKLTPRDMSRIFGWTETRIEALLDRYVSADEIARDMLSRISTEQ